MSIGELTPGDGLLLRAFKDHPADTVTWSYGAPKEKGRYHLALWLGTWAEGEATVDERLNMLGWVFNPELARELRPASGMQLSEDVLAAEAEGLQPDPERGDAHV